MNKHLTPLINAYVDYFGLSKNPVVWEVGSRDGDDAVEIADYISEPGAKRTVVALEPNPEQAEIIRKKHPEIRVIQMAASDRNGRANFMVYEGDEGEVGSSSLDPNWKSGLKGHMIRVRVSRLDALIGNQVIDVMKIDVEGNSLKVLIGLGDKIEQVRVLHIETEKWSGSDVAVKSYMKGWGFKLVDESEEYADMPDLVYVNEDVVL
jgi:FkbM family methyltransferase